MSPPRPARPAAPAARSSPRVGAALGLAVLLLASLASLRAVAEPPQGSLADQVARWIEDLRADDYATRESAREALASQGREIADLLRRYQDDPDPEVGRTVRLLLERLGQRPTVQAPVPRDLQEVGLVRFAGQGSVRELFDALGAAHGAVIVLPEAFDGDRALPVDGSESVPFFQALRDLGRRVGLRPGDGFDRSGRIEMVPGVVDARPAAATGPMQVRVDEVTRTRVLGPGGSRRFAVGIELTWSPAVQLISWSTPQQVEAADPEGRPYEPSLAMRTQTTHGISTTATRAHFPIHLDPTSDDALPELGSLSFELPVWIRHERRELRFALEGPGPQTLLLEDDPAPGSASEPRVTLEAVQAPEVEGGAWSVRLTAHLGSTPATRSLEVLLEQADGTLHPAHAGSRFPAADGRLELTARAYGLGDEAPIAVRVRWFAAEEHGVLPFRLTGVPLR